MSKVTVALSTEKVQEHYIFLAENIDKWRQELGRPLTLAEKILFSHLEDKTDLKSLKRGHSFIMLKPDRVAMQDATAQMALLQFIQSKKTQVTVPATVHCDHLIIAHMGVETDIKVSSKDNAEVFDFLKSASEKYGIGFWGPGSGIIHQVVFENYAYPGALMIGTDSHTPNAGGLGMLAIGVGGADAVDVLTGRPWELLNPHVIAVKLTGQLNKWASPKDIILRVLDILTVKGGTNKIVEYIGEGTESLSCTGKGTITNMGAELGATTSVFPFDQGMARYLHATERSEVAALAQKYSEHLKADPEVLKDPEKYYDEVYEIDLSTLEPYMVGPHSPDRARPISKLKDEVKDEGYPDDISACLIGSCTNSSYEDIFRASSVAKEALSHGIKAKTPFYISPGSMQIFATIKRDGLLKILEDFGGVLLANACGPCIGQWKRDDIKKGDRNSIVTSFNRNFRGRNDANKETLGFIASPEMVVAYAASGSLSFNPLADSLQSESGKEILLLPPKGPDLPSHGFVKDKTGYFEPPESGENVQLKVDPASKRLQLLEPFTAWDGQDFKEHLLLAKVFGKCTTDHISPAGPWLRFRGHLENISNNMLEGGVNAFLKDEPGQGRSQLDPKKKALFSELAKSYKQAGKPWVIVGDENYGEGSSREHAAMSPRFLAASTVIVKSFARIHETNLKKQGVLALTFVNSDDYDKVQEADRISVSGLKDLVPGSKLKVTLHHEGGKTESFEAQHSYNKEQLEWFKAGSSLNLIS